MVYAAFVIKKVNADDKHVYSNSQDVWATQNLIVRREAESGFPLLMEHHHYVDSVEPTDELWFPNLIKRKICKDDIHPTLSFTSIRHQVGHEWNNPVLVHVNNLLHLNALGFQFAVKQIPRRRD